MDDKSPMSKSNKSASTSSIVPPIPTTGPKYSTSTKISAEPKSRPKTNHETESKEYADYNINPTP